jgi:heavy metal sensor kinase
MIGSVRTRLTLWYAGVLALSLFAFGGLTYFAASRSFYQQQDESLRSTAETVASAYQQEYQEEQSIEKANEGVLAEMFFPNRFVEIVDGHGNPIAWSSNLKDHKWNLSVAETGAARNAPVGFVKRASFDGDDEGVRIAVVRFATSASDTPWFALVGEPLGIIDERLESLRTIFLASAPLIIVLASLGGYFLARKSLSPITSMEHQTRSITSRNLSSRLDVSNPGDELGRLAITINELLARLDSAFEEQRRFIADASHELRTPIAILRGEAEISLERSRNEDEYRAALSLINSEASRLSRIVDALFTLASSDSGNKPLETSRFYLNEMVADCARAAGVLADRKGIALDVGELPELIATGDESLLKQMLLNLLDNAVKYTVAGHRVSLDLSRDNANAVISVRDSGIGIPASALPHVFDRFFRVDKVRSREAGGAGLGLSISRWIAEAHGGTISVSSEINRGSVFTVSLPVHRPDHASPEN